MRALIALPILLFVGLCLLSQPGCQLIPKDVEYGQEEVPGMPDRPAKDDETLRQAAQLARDRAAATERAALEHAAPPEILDPATDTADLTAAVSDRLGPPMTPWRGEVALLLELMDRQEARHQRELEAFAARLAELKGKKIEGTGVIQLPYVVNLALIGGVLLFAWTAIRMVAVANAPLQVRLNTISGGSRFMARAFTEVVEGGQEFQRRLRTRLQDNQGLMAELEKEFIDAHRGAQGAEVQAAVKALG